MRKSNVASQLAMAAASSAVRSLMGKAKSAAGRKGSRAATRRRRRGRVTTRRGKGKETKEGWGEYTKRDTALGRKPRPTLRAAWKLLNQNKSSTVFAHRSYSQFGGNQGAIALANISATSTTGLLEVPCHLWEVTSAVNPVNGVITAPNVAWVPNFSNPTDTATLTWVNGRPLSVENADNATNQSIIYPNGSDTLEWIQAKMLFYAPTTLPCRYAIDVVQIKDTRLVPDNANVTQFACAFWQNVIKRFTFSPLEPGSVKYQKYFRILHSQSFILNPKESTEAVNTIFREVNIFLRLNRRATYDWEDQDRINMVVQDGPVNLDANQKTQVYPRARIYVMIRAMARNGSAFSTTIHPSYDMVLRMKHSQLSA